MHQHNNIQEQKPVDKLDVIKTFSAPVIWVVGLIFAGGMVYTKVTSMEQSDKQQSSNISQLKDAQIRTAEAVERMEKNQKDSNEKIFIMLNKTMEKQSALEKQVLTNEIKIQNLEKKHKD